MELHQPIPYSGYSSQHTLDNSSGLAKVRQPLSDSTGNAQLNTLASAGSYHDVKGLLPRERPMYLPMLPSQPQRQPIVSKLEQRRRAHRQKQQIRHEQIAKSEEYKRYREKIDRENSEEVKWPDELEGPFLDALLWMPKMGRRKFSMKNAEGKIKPYGRNELIAEFIWLGYVQNLPPGAVPDPTMMRDRKQVSSHIQVLKKFFEHHPAARILFPSSPDRPKNGFEDSFKNDPCLTALAKGRLPGGKDTHDNPSIIANNSYSMKPVIFWVLIMSSRVPREYEHVHDEKDFINAGLVQHKPTGLSVQKQSGSLHSIPSWRHRFPDLARLYVHNDINCEIIHMDVSLDLMRQHPPTGSQLYSRMDLAIPGRQPNECEWRIITTLNKPRELYQDPISEPKVEGQQSMVAVMSVSQVQTRIKVPFPATSWANAFTCLTTLQSKYEESLATGLPDKPASHYVDQISMYQEVQCSPNPRSPFIRKAIIVWTFSAREGDGATTWRYLDPNPPRSICMSPSPHPSHHVSAGMNENFNTWASALGSSTHTPLNLQLPNQNTSLNTFDPYGHGLATPPQTAGLASPFTVPGNGGFDYGHPFEMPGENLSFVSNATMDSETTLVDDFSTSFSAGGGMGMGDYSDQGSWTQGFEDPTWGGYGVASVAQGVVGWDGAGDGKQGWLDGGEVKGLEAGWVGVDVEGEEKGVWGARENGLGMGESTDPEKSHQPLSFESNMEQKFVPWIDGHQHQNGEMKEYDQRELEDGFDASRDGKDEYTQNHEVDSQDTAVDGEMHMDERVNSEAQEGIKVEGEDNGDLWSTGDPGRREEGPDYVLVEREAPGMG